MIRVVRLPGGEVEIDERGRQSGRGAYVCPQPQCVTLCLKRKLLEKALKCAVPETVKARLKELGHVDAESERLAAEAVNRDAVAALGMARRAGELIIGQDRVMGALSAGEKLLVLTSADASETLRRALSIRGVRFRPMNGVDRRALGGALGLRQTVIAALPEGSGFAEKLNELIPEEGGTAVEQDESLRACETA